MRYKRYAIKLSKNYMAKIYKLPEQNHELDFTLHWHREYEMIYMKSGTLTLGKLNQDINITDGDIYFINSEELHSYSGFDDSSVFYVINFPPEAIRSYFDDPKEILTFSVKKDSPAYDRLKFSLDALEGCENIEGRLEALKIKAVLNNIFFYLIKYCRDSSLSFVKGSDSEDFDCAKSAINYMQRNFRKDIPLGEIAGYVGMTPAHFSAYFKDKTEMTFSRYLRRIRLGHAIDDMIKNDLSVKSSALNNGFPNVNSLIIACKEEYGRTPLEMKHFLST